MSIKQLEEKIQNISEAKKLSKRDIKKTIDWLDKMIQELNKYEKQYYFISYDFFDYIDGLKTDKNFKDLKTEKAKNQYVIDSGNVLSSIDAFNKKLLNLRMTLNTLS